MVFSALKCAVWSYRADGEDVVSQIMWGFLLFIPPDQLTFTSTDLGLQWKITTRKPVLLLCSVLGRAAEPRKSQSNPLGTVDPQRVHLIVFPFISSTWSEILDVYKLPFCLLNPEQKMGSMWQPITFPDICVLLFVLLPLHGNLENWITFEIIMEIQLNTFSKIGPKERLVKNQEN